MTKWSVVGVLVGVGLAMPLPASAYCAPGSSFASNSSVRVVVHPALASQLQHFDGTAWTDAEVDRAMWHAISALNESANADIPFVYYDYVNDPTCGAAWLDTNCTDSVQPELSCTIPNTIVVVPSNCVQTSILGYGDGRAGLLRIWSSSTTWGGGIRITHGAFDNADSFEFTILHELGHALGLGHADGSQGAVNCSPAGVPNPAVCPPGSFGTCGIMMSDVGSGYSGTAYNPDDVNGLQFVWGDRTLPAARSFEDVDLTTASFAELPMADVDVAGFLSAASSPTAFRSALTLAGLRRVAPNNASVRVFGWEWSTGNTLWSADLNLPTAVSGSVG